MGKPLKPKPGQPKRVRRRSTAAIRFPETTWRQKTVDIFYRRPSGKHVARFLRDPKKRERLRGMQSYPTKVVKKFAEQFKGKDLKTIEEIIRALRHFKIVRVPAGDLKYFYSTRTAEDIIATKSLIVLDPVDAEKTELLVHGCVDSAVAMVSILRAKKIKAKFVRDGPHSYVFFWMDGQKYIADPSYTRRAMPKGYFKVFPALEKEHEMKLGALWPGMAVGKDAWDVGLFTIDDYAKYYPEFMEKQRLRELGGELELEK